MQSPQLITKSGPADLPAQIDRPRVSPLGIGCYRMSRSNPEHQLALIEALQAGCSLIDTASNYMEGESEQLVGEILSETGKAAKVVTKAGYVTPIEMPFLASPQGSYLRPELVFRPGHSPHCIHPDFLAAQIEQSLCRLKRPMIDVFLLHNPEHQFSETTDRDAVLQQIAKAFAFLEELVEKGRIGAYGISSNTLVARSAPANTLALDELVEQARKATISNGFKVLQFPANLFERDALTPSDGTSLLASAHAHGLDCMANRPLSAVVEGEIVHLVSGAQEVRDLDDRAATEAFDTLIDTINERLEAMDVEPQASSLPLIAEIDARLRDKSAFDDAQFLFELPMRMTFEQMFPDNLPPTVTHPIEILREFLRERAISNRYRRGTEIRASLANEGQIDPQDTRNLQTLACSLLLDDGFDHVLVGARRVEYVQSLSTLFAR